MQDKLTSVAKNCDLTGSSLNREVVETLKEFLADGEKRVQVAGVIGSNAAEIVKTAVSLLFQEYPELVSPGGNAYTTRRYNMYVRDMNYFLRYCSYAIVAGDASVLDERLLAGLRDTFNSLGIPLGPTARSIQLMKNIVKEKLVTAGMTNITFVDEPFDYVVREISETEI
ncbi:MAG: Phycobiliprotein beta chain [Chroococcidiopsis cubana SAG 39.79]|jgi:phycobilisome core component|uniref:Allophycocyanin beta-18 subunit apoprotein n=2 Tax=Chroococcidiopsis TaxID=54298 RepID=K9TY40_CHRTP|nr:MULTISPECIES: allophycocyanin subunit beta [Chroococcidiopsis]MBE9018176.1 allophycocyanin subunit beta [Chroococcidiopsidales cyanobacterium LEGE 13417]PSB42139.1 allophycocyanin subunit beta [Cyanosarcina cf. burmensis CCALA 770]AFY87283.1 allophycocyanin beta-18 subunit apoprotein [Chroococcidiopsis thermalis PCC 7203]MDV2991635.1 Phycobiliprotein beta chain [Chroococcidiopsis sp. SAG 2025]MDZ4874637.1 Phycobiliprotein beta chain [Chroococcidiopsis cubana SAG 39.79]